MSIYANKTNENKYKNYAESSNPLPTRGELIERQLKLDGVNGLVRQAFESYRAANSNGNENVTSLFYEWQKLAFELKCITTQLGQNEFGLTWANPSVSIPSSHSQDRSRISAPFISTNKQMANNTSPNVTSSAIRSNEIREYTNRAPAPEELKKRLLDLDGTNGNNGLIKKACDDYLYAQHRSGNGTLIINLLNNWEELRNERDAISMKLKLYDENSKNKYISNNGSRNSTSSASRSNGSNETSNKVPSREELKKRLLDLDGTHGDNGILKKVYDNYLYAQSKSGNGTLIINLLNNYEELRKERDSVRAQLKLLDEKSESNNIVINGFQNTTSLPSNINGLREYNNHTATPEELKKRLIELDGTNGLIEKAEEDYLYAQYGSDKEAIINSLYNLEMLRNERDLIYKKLHS